MHATIAGLLMVAAAAGAAHAAERTYDVGSFDKVSISSGISAVIDVGAPQSVSAQANTDSLLRRLDVSVRGRKLEVGLRWNMLDWLFNIGVTKEITVHIGAPALAGVEASAESDVDVHKMTGDTVTIEASSGGVLSGDGLAGSFVTLESSSGATVSAEGSCGKLIAEASSGASVMAERLTCRDVNVSASSGGHAWVSASASVGAEASSGGSVSIHRHPGQTSVNSSSGGSVQFSSSGGSVQFSSSGGSVQFAD